MPFSKSTQVKCFSTRNNWASKTVNKPQTIVHLLSVFELHNLYSTYKNVGVVVLAVFVFVCV